MGFRSFILLASQFWLHIFKRLLFLYRPGGTTRFVANFKEDRILPIPGKQADVIAELQRCTGCGLCDGACPLTGESTSQGAFSIAFLAFTGWQDLSAAHHNAELAQLMTSCADCKVCEAACPENVPLLQIPELISLASEAASA